MEAKRVSLHLRAAIAAVAGVALLLICVRADVRRQLPGRLESFTSSPSSLKMTGNMLQTAAFRDPAMLPVYGSSELDHRAGNRLDQFFRTRPTGFSVFTIGHAGTTCLMILQKLACAGDAARGKKAVIFLSPSWFVKQEVAGRAVTANLPASQLCAWIFASPLPRATKERIARRLLDYPDAMEKQPMLAAAVQALADPTAPHRALLDALWLPGEVQNKLCDWVEGCALFWELHRHPERNRRQTYVETSPLPGQPDAQHAPDWTQLAQRAEERDRKRNDGTFYSATMADAIGSQRRETRESAKRSGGYDTGFEKKMNQSKEWGDLVLLVEVLHELKLHVEFISQPFNGNYYDTGGTTEGGRAVYYAKLASIIGPAGFPLRDYSERELDRFFFNDAGHPSAKAWIYYDEAMDEFYHDRPPGKPGADGG